MVISHTFREANGVSDWIANYEVHVGNKVRWLDELIKHVDLKAIINYDVIHSKVGKICKD